MLRKLPFPTGYGPTLVVQQDVVLLSVENQSMTALSAADGKTLWTAEHHPGGHVSPDDMLVDQRAGLVGRRSPTGSNSGVLTGRDLHTGEVKCEFPPDVHPDWFHHRCYRSRATDKYFIASRTGIEFIDLEAKHWDINHWVRGGCLYGFMPANGLIYAPPQIVRLLPGIEALRLQRLGGRIGQPARCRASARRAAGWSAARRTDESLAPSPVAAPGRRWPTYRHDAARSGSVQTPGAG